MLDQRQYFLAVAICGNNGRTGCVMLKTIAFLEVCCRPKTLQDTKSKRVPSGQANIPWNQNWKWKLQHPNRFRRTKILATLSSHQEWLHLPLEYWTLMKDYKNLWAFVSVLEFVNDSAERGIKIVSDFKDMCRNLDTQEYLFQVVEAHRKKMIDFKK